MKPNWLKYNLVFFYSFIIFGLSVQAQFLDIPLIGQKKSNWCYAASLEMTITYHNKPVSGQCDFVKEFITLHYRSQNNTPHNGTFPVGCCEDNCKEGGGTLTCNYTVDFPRRGGKVYPQYMDMIFANNGFYSIEDIHTDLMDWNAIRNEIQSCRPFLVSLGKGDGISHYNHVVVAKGYYEMLSSQFVLVNDPLPECFGCETLLPISIFSDDPNHLNSALEVVRFIYPRDESTCDNCEKKSVVTTTELITAVENNPDLFTTLGGHTIFNTHLIDLLDDVDATGADRYFTNSYSYGYIDWSVLTYKYVDYIGFVSDLTTPRLAFFMEQSGSSWIIKSITKADCTVLTKAAKFFLAEQQLSDTIFMSGDDIGVVEFMPDFQPFYRVNYKESVYLSPVRDYPGLSFKIGYLYREKEVLDMLLKFQQENRNTLSEANESNKSSDGEKVEVPRKRGLFDWLFKKKKSGK